MEPQALPQSEERIPALPGEEPGERLRTPPAESDPVGLEQQQPLREWMPDSLAAEVLVALCMGLVFAAILVLGTFLLTGRLGPGLAVGLATLTTISLASTAGIAVPMVLRRLELDPALATGLFPTAMNDVMGIVVYLLVASLILF